MRIASRRGCEETSANSRNGRSKLRPYEQLACYQCCRGATCRTLRRSQCWWRFFHTPVGPHHQTQTEIATFGRTYTESGSSETRYG